MLDPIRTSEVTEAVAAAAAAAQAEIDKATVRRVGEDNPSDPVVAVENRISGKAETRKLRVTVTISAKVDPPEDREVATDHASEVEEYEARRARLDAQEAETATEEELEDSRRESSEAADENALGLRPEDLVVDEEETEK